MVNAWSLLYEELNGTMDKTYPIKEDDMSPCNLDDIKITSLESDEYDPIYTVGSGNTASISTDNTYYVDTTTFGDITIDTSNWDDSFLERQTPGLVDVNMDHIVFDDASSYDTLNINVGDNVVKPCIEKQGCHKYEEDKSIKALQDYVSTTYGGHYTSDKNDVQTLDLIESVGDAEAFCRSNAIKYLSRYDKKGQAKRDILKALHYTLLLYYFSGHTNETPTRGYETF